MESKKSNPPLPGTPARRVFLRQAGASATAVAIACAGRRAEAQCVQAGDVLEPTAIDGALALGVDGILPFEFPVGHPCILVRLRESVDAGVGPDRDLVAFSAVCPHRGYRFGPESYKAEHGALGPCPWHNSAFDLKCGGAQIIGQANRRLPRIVLEERDGDVFAVSVEGNPDTLLAVAG